MTSQLLICLAALPLISKAWTGSLACSGCHSAIYASYIRTPMALSSGRVGSPGFRESFGNSQFLHPASHIRYRVSREGDQVNFECASADGEILATQRLDYFVGSGRVGRSYLFSIGNFLYQAPVSYYSAKSKWDLSPGYEHYDHLYFARPVKAACLRCHATRVSMTPGTENGFEAVPFVEGGIGCEVCHGEGDQHAGTSGRKPDAHAIVNPAKLTSEQRDAVCARCHLSGAARIAKPGRDLAAFRPGDRLPDYLSVFVRSDSTRELKATSHFEKYARSKCKIASGEKMWCGTCHDPHAVPAESGKADYFRRKCLGCHRDQGCSEKASVRSRVANNCIACHMPQNMAVGLQHAAYTDHSIPRRPAAASNAVLTSCVLEPFSGFQQTDRDLALAYAEVALENNDRFCRTRAFELLRKVEPLNTGDAAILVQLAYLYDFSSKETEAIPLYERALEVDPGQVTALINLGAALSSRGQVDRAMQLWDDALARSPGSETASVNLAIAQARAGNLQAAKITVSRALRLSPGSTMLRNLQATLLRAAP